MIAVENVSFSYNKKPFMSDVTFEVKEGEIFGFLGPSGAGKSTLQKILIGMLPNYHGHVKVFEQEVRQHKNDYYENIGIDFEFPSLYEKMSARENMKFFGSLYKKNPRNVDELLEEVGLLKDADKKISEYSKGMKGRLNFAKSLLHNPKILFLDEPTSGLDPSNSRIMKDMILKERERGTTIIITTHNMQDATELCDRVAFIVDGKLKALDTPHNLIMQKGAGKIQYSYLQDGKEQTSECMINESGKEEKLIRLIQDGKLLTIHSCEPDLGDIFMDITGRKLQ